MSKSAKEIQRDKELLLEALEKSNGLIAHACRKVGLSRTTYYRWYKEDESFKNRADDIQEFQLDVAESVLFKLISDGNVAATIFLLKTKGKKRGYTEKNEVDVNNLNPFLELMKRATASDDE